MNALASKRLLVGFSVVTLILAVLAAWGWARAAMDEVQVMLADGHTGMLQEARDAALLSTNITEVADALRFVGTFYRPPQPPSGRERHRYNVMERVRTSYQKDLVARLRQLSGDQLSDDPKPWIEKYAKKDR